MNMSTTMYRDGKCHFCGKRTKRQKTFKYNYLDTLEAREMSAAWYNEPLMCCECDKAVSGGENQRKLEKLNLNK